MWRSASGEFLIKNTTRLFVLFFCAFISISFLKNNDVFALQVPELIEELSYDSNFPPDFVEFNGEIYFSADDGEHGQELWRTDNASGGVVLVKDLIVGSGSSYPHELTVWDGSLYFSATYLDSGFELWVSDGTTDGTVLLKEIGIGTSAAPSDFIEYNGELFFTANDGTNGYELWKTDGTAGGTVMVVDINPTGYSSPSSKIIYDSQIYFIADDGTNGRELWQSDGTALGTVMVKDVYPGPTGSYIYDLEIYNGNLYFAAIDSVYKYLWVSDGTEGGTVLFTEMEGAEHFTIFNGELYFTAFDEFDIRELCKTDGTKEGTMFLSDDNINFIFGEVDGELLINRFNSESGGTELWKTDGTLGGEDFVAEINPNNFTYIDNQKIIFNNQLYFLGQNDALNAELWKSDSTSAGTAQLADIVDGTTGSYPEQFYIFNNRLYFFTAQNELGLWRIDEPTQPDIPAGLGVNPYDRTFAMLSWDKPADNGSTITDYILAFQETGGAWIYTDTASDNTYYYIDTLTTDTQYSFKVKAINGLGESAYSDSFTFTTGDPGDMEEPINLGVSGDGVTVDLSWDPPEHTNGYMVSQYYLEYKSSEEGWDGSIYWLYTGNSDTTLEDLVLPDLNTTYDFRLSAINTIDEEGPFSSEVSFTTDSELLLYIKNCSSSTDPNNLGLLGITGYPASTEFRLANNIDCTSETFAPLHFGDDGFMGILNGQNYTILNLNYNENGTVGLFDIITDATIKDINLISEKVYPFGYPLMGSIGAVAGLAYGNILIQNVTTDIDLSGYASSAGGLIGSYESGGGTLIISDVTNLGDITINKPFRPGPGLVSAGGLIGSVICDAGDECLIIENSNSNSIIYSYVNSGGLVGAYFDMYGSASLIDNSYFNGTLDNSGLIGTLDYAGGLIGYIYMEGSIDSLLSINKSYSDGEYMGGWGVGGLIGEYDNYSAGMISIENSYSTAHIETSDASGGLVGVISQNTNGLDVINTSIIDNSYFTGEILNYNGYSGGIVGYNENWYVDPGKLAIIESFNTGTIECASYDCGGFVGYTWGNNLLIQDSYSQGDISGPEIGGLIGYGDGLDADNLIVINNSYSSGNLTSIGDEAIGGLVGYSETYISITNSFSSSLLTGGTSYVGAIIGYSEDPFLYDFNNNYFDQTTGGVTRCLGYDGNLSEPGEEGEITGCTPVNTDGGDADYFKNNNENPPLDGWTFGTVWFKKVEDYPILRFELNDTSGPIITILGSANMTITTGTTYTDAGATALDNVDGDRTENIVTTGTVNTALAGTYTIQYRVCDLLNNCTTATRIVIVRNPVVYTVTPTETPSHIILNDYVEYLDGSGKTLDLIDEQIIYFYVNEIEHTATVKEVSTDSAVLWFESDVQIISFEIGETQEIDVTGDGLEDIEVTLNSITSGVVNMTFSQLNLTTKPTPTLSIIPTAKTVTPTPITSVQGSSAVTWILSGAGIIVCMFILFLIFKKTSKNES